MLVGHPQRNGLALLFEFNDNLRHRGGTGSLTNRQVFAPKERM